MTAEFVGKPTGARLLVLAFILAAGCGQQEASTVPTTAQPTTSRSPTTSASAASTAAAATPKADFSLSAEDFVKDLEKDLASTEKKYRDKVIEVSGLVDGFRWLGPKDSRQLGPIEEAPNPPARSILKLDAGEHGFGLQCITLDKEPWASVSRGQKVKVHGRWHAPGGSEFPSLAECVIVDKGIFTTPVFTAEDLVREYVADMDAFATKYDDQDLIVSGEVEKRAVLALAPTVIRLRTDNAVACICNSYGINWGIGAVFTAPLPGDEVEYFGRYSKRNSSDKAISIVKCLPITKPAPGAKTR